MDNNIELKKHDYLAIPIEMYKCEVVIRKNRRLSEIEKLTLKFIHKENSLESVINAFNVGPYVMNNVFAKLFYRGLIKLKLNRKIVQLTNKILKLVEENKLDDYIDEAAEYNYRYIAILQEKISGEIFIENSIKNYTKNPGPLTTNYIDLQSAPLNQFSNFKDLSLNKFVKCIRNEIKINPEDIEKINFLNPLHYIKLYVPLFETDGIKKLDLDLDLFPRSVQKAWQNAYETKCNLDTEDMLDFEIDYPQFIPKELFKIHFSKKLILIDDDLKQYAESDKNLGLNYFIKEDYEDLKKNIKQLEENIQSIDEIKFHFESSKIYKQIENLFLDSRDFIIICSTELDNISVPFYKSIIKKLENKNVKILLLWSAINESEGENIFKRISEFKRILFTNLRRETISKIMIETSILPFDNNFMIFDNKILLISNYPFLAWDFNDENCFIPSIIVKGGTTPLKFLDFLLELFPKEYQFKKYIEDLLVKNYSNINRLLSKERIEFINQLRDFMKNLKTNIQIGFVDGVKSSINNIKSKLNEIERFSSISLIQDMEHVGILVDTMRENNEELYIFTDDVDKRKLGPNFRKYLNKVKNIFVILEKSSKSSDESQWNIAISEFEKIKKNNKNFNYKIIEDCIKFNSILVKNNFIIISNYKFLADIKAERYRTQKKKLGLIIYPNNINEILDKLLIA